MSSEMERTFCSLSLSAEQIVTGCLASFDSCSQNERNEVKISDVADHIARKYRTGHSEESLQAFILNFKEELSTLIFNSEYITRDVFINVVSSFVAGEPFVSRERIHEEQFVHEPSVHVVDEDPLNNDNNNVTPVQAFRTVERYNNDLYSLERKLSSKTKQVEQLEEVIKRLGTDKDGLVKKIAQLEEDIENRSVIADECKRLELENRSLKSRMQTLNRQMNEVLKNEDKLEAEIEDLKNENASLTKKVTRLNEFENKALSLEIQLALVAEEKDNAVRQCESIRRALIEKEQEEAERIREIEELRRNLREIRLLNEENDPTGHGLLRAMYHCEPETLPEMHSPSLMAEMGAAAASTPIEMSTSRMPQLVDASMMTALETYDASTSPTTTPIRATYDREHGRSTPIVTRRRIFSVDDRIAVNSDATRFSPLFTLLAYVMRVTKLFGRIAVYAMILFLVYVISLNVIYVVLYVTGCCVFDRWSCGVTIFERRFVYYRPKGPIPI